MGTEMRWKTTLLAGLLVLLPTSASAATTCSLSGTAFTDVDRSGSWQADEPVRSGDVVYLYDGSGAYVAGATTDASGSYTFDGLACGGYRVEYGATTWWGLRSTHVPTTTGSVQPVREVAISGAARADFGWRTILRSTTAGQPITSFTGPTGLRVESYDDAVPARELYDALATGTLGAEAPSVTVRFDLSGTSTTSTSIGATLGRYDRFAAISSVSWLSWLDGGPTTLAHEYGHAWGMYRAYLVQQDPTLSSYLAARGLTDDPRLDTSYAWGRDELLAEDYRQLLGPPAARTTPQANTDLPPAAAVAGLRDHLLGAFSGPPTASSSPTATPSPSPSPSPVVSPAPSPSHSIAPTLSPSPSSKKGGCRRAC